MKTRCVFRNAPFHIRTHTHTHTHTHTPVLQVVYDRNLNAHVVDLNSGPSFYHAEKDKPWPPWFLSERSQLLRAEQDVRV